MNEITRLAPSPTGALHLGNARTFLVNYLLARQNGWRILLRIEDIDGPRIKKGADRQAIDDLHWLGITWDTGPIYQSTRLPTYQSALQTLLKNGHAYPCVCSRSEVHSAASAPHADDGAAIYPGTCRGRFKSVEDATRTSGKAPAIRFRVPDEIIEFEDQFARSEDAPPPNQCPLPRTRGRGQGEGAAENDDPPHPHRIRFDVTRQLGDFVIAKADGTPAYQLAVVVDDAEMGITRVVRGDDLLDSTPRQLLLYRALGLTHREPAHYHLPLITGPDGRRLAKRHGDTRLTSYRDQGVSAGKILHLLARWCGMTLTDEPSTAADLLPLFDLSRVPRHAIVFSPHDDAWLRGVSNQA